MQIVTKRTGISMLIANKIHFKPKSVKKDTGYWQKDYYDKKITIMSKQKAPKYKYKQWELEGETDSWIIM